MLGSDRSHSRIAGGNLRVLAAAWGRPIPMGSGDHGLRRDGPTARRLGFAAGTGGPAWLSFCALVGWAILPVVAAIHRFRRVDLNE